jgi:PEP-CTERM motif-containing protein
VKLNSLVYSIAIAATTVSVVTTANAGSILFSTGNPNGLIATLSVPASGTNLETETADDFILGQNALINGATFTGLLPLGTPLSAVNDVEIELYHVFPVDSVNPPDGRVATRVNSPSDNQFAAYDSALSQLSFTASILNTSFTAGNSVTGGINPIPNQFTGGNGPITGEEVQFAITFATPFFVGATDHDFFRPEVGVTGGNFLWLSAPKPIVAPGTPFNPDLQSWIRTDGTGGLAPDWERIGTDVTGEGPFNASFSLSGTTVPEPSSVLLLGVGLAALAWQRLRSL